MVDATLTKFSRSRKIIAKIMKSEVNKMDIIGVFNFMLILANIDGIKLSSDIAIGILEDVNNPAFPVVTNAIIAAIESIQNPPFPKILEDANANGFNV